MKTLFLIDGAAGTGKSDLVAYIASRKKRLACVVQKYTTRSPRAEEESFGVKTDLRFPPDTLQEFGARTKERGFYWYMYGEKNTQEQYGFYRDDILDALGTHDYGLLIVRDFDTIQAVKRDFPDVRCISVFVYTDRDLVERRLRKDGYSPEAIALRLSRLPLAWADYVKHCEEYDEKIINSSDRKDFEILIEALFRKAERTPSGVIRVAPHKDLLLPSALVGFKEGMQERLIARRYDKNVFLMMKYRRANARVHRFIERTLADHGLNCVRADDAEWDITRNTYNPVAVLFCCKFGVALFDEREEGNEYSPNVAYELGMMHDQGKECLILRHKTLSGVPFDLAKELYVEYDDNLALEDIIKEWVGKIAEHAASR